MQESDKLRMRLGMQAKGHWIIKKQIVNVLGAQGHYLQRDGESVSLKGATCTRFMQIQLYVPIQSSKRATGLHNW